MRAGIAIKVPKDLNIEGASIVRLKNGKIFFKSEGNLYPVAEFTLEIPKYVVEKEGGVVCKVLQKGVIKRMH